MGKISFFLKEAFGSLKRNSFMTTAALVTVFLSTFMLGGVLIFVFTTNALLSEVEQKVQITVFLKTDPDPTADEVASMQAEIAAWPEVKNCTYVSKEEALERMRREYADSPELLESITGNPFPASFEITLVDPHAVDVVAARFEGNPIVDEVQYGEDVAEKLFALTAQARNLMLIFIALQGIVAILLISNTIRLSVFARKQEVEIMRLVGATNWFIRWPFVIEGVTVGLVGAGVAAGLVLWLNHYFLDRVSTSLSFLEVPMDAVPYLFVAAVLLGTGVVIGALGSAIGLRRFLKV